MPVNMLLCGCQRKSPADLDHPRARPTGRNPVDRTQITPNAPAEQDDTLDAQYYALEQPCCCLDGWVFVGYEEDGEEYFERYACRRCGKKVS
jgi:hypothetical protein